MSFPMGIVKWIILGVAALLGIFTGVTAFLPKEYTVERSTEIEAPPEAIFSQIVDLEEWLEWNPWATVDPEIQIEHGERMVGLGAQYSWKSDVTGNGEMRISQVVAPVKVRYEMTFEGFEDVPSYSTIALSSTDPTSPTTVTWSFEGSVGDRFFARWLTLFMDNVIGDSYDKGLQNLKERVEAGRGA